MKRNIEVKEKELIERLNNRDSRYEVHMDPAAGDDKTVVTRWDNNGPVQFEEQEEKTPCVEPVCNAYTRWSEEEDYPVKDEFEDEYGIHRTYKGNKGPKINGMEISLTPRDYDGTFANIPDETEYNPQDTADSRLAADKSINPSALQSTLEDINYKRLYNDPCLLSALRRVLKECDRREQEEKEYTRLRTPYEKPTVNVDLPFNPEKYEEVNHPQHYNNYDVEVIDMMERVFGREATATFCKLNAFKYRMRAGTKPGQSADKDLNKERWYLAKKEELEKKL